MQLVKAKDYCFHSSIHTERRYSKNNFITEGCRVYHQCPYQEGLVQCRKVRGKRK